jgi:D-tyrosyl-tRNA(Tyr) deacylase
MKAVVQRVSQASVEVDQQVVGEIKKGFVVLLGINQQDIEEDANYLAEKIIHLRIFQDEQDKMNLSLLDVAGEILIISQFTLYANTRKGRRPSFIDAALPEKAEHLYRYFINKFKESRVKVSEGIFGAMMLVHISNDGPVTIIIDSEDRHKPRK